MLLVLNLVAKAIYFHVHLAFRFNTLNHKLTNRFLASKMLEIENKLLLLVAIAILISVVSEQKANMQVESGSGYFRKNRVGSFLNFVRQPLFYAD